MRALVRRIECGGPDGCGVVFRWAPEEDVTVEEMRRTLREHKQVSHLLAWGGGKLWEWNPLTRRCPNCGTSVGHYPVATARGLACDNICAGILGGPIPWEPIPEAVRRERGL